MELHAVQGLVPVVQRMRKLAQIIYVWDVVCRNDDEFFIELVKIAAVPGYIFLKVI